MQPAKELEQHLSAIIRATAARYTRDHIHGSTSIVSTGESIADLYIDEPDMDDGSLAAVAEALGPPQDLLQHI